MTFEGISLKCKNFGPFGEEPQGFDEIKPINVIIGRNNSGKSTLLDIVEFATQPKDIGSRAHRGNAPSVQSHLSLTKDDIDSLPYNEQSLNWQSTTYHVSFQRFAVQGLRDKKLICELGSGSSMRCLGWTNTESAHPRDVHTSLQVGNVVARRRGSPFGRHIFRRVAAERDVIPEAMSNPPSIDPSGRGLSSLLATYINAESLDSSLVEETLLAELNAIFYPDAIYTRLLVQQLTSGPWELFLVEETKGRIPLSRTGSGLKTVLLVLANLIFGPLLGKNATPIDRIIFGFEELENNLHPAVQRRLFRYLANKALALKFHLFVTTHSNVVIDMFSGDKNAQLLHVNHDGMCGRVTRVETQSHGYHILDDLDIRASDLLQTNVVVWVEGPSDRIYFKRWLKLWEPRLIEGVHYQCLMFGGSANAHYNFEPPELESELIKAIRVSRHVIFLSDRDRGDHDQKLKIHTERIENEVVSSHGVAWITDGREIENYIPVDAIRNMLSKPRLEGPDKGRSMFEYLADVEKRAKRKKVPLAHAVSPYLTRENLASTLDLAERLNEVCAKICEWNRLDTPTQ